MLAAAYDVSAEAGKISARQDQLGWIRGDQNFNFGMADYPA